LLPDEVIDVAKAMAGTSIGDIFISTAHAVADDGNISVLI